MRLLCSTAHKTYKRCQSDIIKTSLNNAFVASGCILLISEFVILLIKFIPRFLLIEVSIATCPNYMLLTTTAHKILYACVYIFLTLNKIIFWKMFRLTNKRLDEQLFLYQFCS